MGRVVSDEPCRAALALCATLGNEATRTMAREATALVERAMDMFAQEIGMDPADVRRRNFITEFPHETVTGASYDSGDYNAALDGVLVEGAPLNAQLEAAVEAAGASAPAA